MSDWNFEGLKITDDDYTGNDISGLANKPSLSAAALKARFDANVKNVVAAKFNATCDRLDLFADSVALDIQYTQEQIANFVAVMLYAWQGTGAVYSYVSADAPTFTMRSTGNTTLAHPPGTKIGLTQSGTTKYFIVTASSYDSGTTYTTITLYGGTDYTLADETITNVGYSYSKSPYGFPLDPAKWSEVLTDTTQRDITSSVTSWQNLGSLQKNIPIGCWYVSYRAYLKALSNTASTSNYPGMFLSISTSNSSESDIDLTTKCGGNNALEFGTTIMSDVTVLSLSSKTLYYVIAKGSGVSTSAVRLQNNESKFILIARCAYL